VSCSGTGAIRSALIGFALAAVVGCQHGREAKAMAVVQTELDLLEPPAGMTPTDQGVGLGEMYAEGAQTYCVGDEKAAQTALDAMLRGAGWERLSESTNPDATVRNYRKDQRQGALTLQATPQPCGRVLRVHVLEPL
jgi:hypothetical protein